MKHLTILLALIIAIGMTITGCESDDSPTSSGPQAPTCSITSPTDSASVADTVFITINASDDNALRSVELFIDSTLVRTWTATPFIFSWNTRVLTDSSWHQIW